MRSSPVARRRSPLKSKQINENPAAYLLVFSSGDEVVSTLTAFARDSKILAAHFYALGALERATLAYWNRETKAYEDIPVDEQVEVVSLIGDVTAGVKGEPRIHAHASLGRRDGSLQGGHLKNAVVHPTLELF